MKLLHHFSQVYILPDISPSYTQNPTRHWKKSTGSTDLVATQAGFQAVAMNYRAVEHLEKLWAKRVEWGRVDDGGWCIFFRYFEDVSDVFFPRFFFQLGSSLGLIGIQFRFFSPFFFPNSDFFPEWGKSFPPWIILRELDGLRIRDLMDRVAVIVTDTLLV